MHRTFLMEGDSHGSRRRRAGLCAAILLCLWFGGQAPAAEENPYEAHIASTDPLTPAEEQKKLRLPPGFEINLFASEPDIGKPMNLAFDHRGRMWVTQSIEYPLPAKDEASARDCVKILEDTDGDGCADKFITFADHLNIPIGVLPLPDGAIVYSVAKLIRLTDTDGDDRADKREDLYTGFEAKDTHGMINGLTWGFDGWVYVCHGFVNQSEIAGRDGHTIRMQSGNTWRLRVDGSRVEQWTHGQVNPFGLCFDPLFNMYTADCHSKPLYMLLRGAYYPSFGKPHDGLGFGPAICEHSHGSTAISGIAYYAADQFPPAYRNTVFIGNVVTCRVNHDKLEPHGSTFKAIEQPDFIRSEDPWFRPVDIQLGPDGALYVADFYNRIIGHYEVPLTHPGRDKKRGRIWRIVYKGANTKPPAQPRRDWSKASTGELIEDLAHPNLWVRMQATNQLAGRTGPVAAIRSTIASPVNAFQRIHSLWALERVGSLHDDVLLEAGNDREPAVRVHVQRILAERKQWTDPLQAMAIAALKDPDAFVQRAAVEALGQHPQPAQIRPLLDLRKKVPKQDIQLLHMVRMSIRDHFRLDESWTWLAESGQPDDRALVIDVVTGLDTPASAVFLFDCLKRTNADLKTDNAHVHHVTKYLPEESLKNFLSFVRTGSYKDLARPVSRLRAVHGGLQKRGLKLTGELIEWAESVVDRLLREKEQPEVLKGIDLVRRLGLKSRADRLVTIASAKSAPEATRKPACETLTAIDPNKYLPVLGRILSDGTEPSSMRTLAGRLIGGVHNQQAIELLATQLLAAPQPLDRVIAEGLAGSKPGGLRLLAEITTGKASPRLLQHPGVHNQLSRQGIDDFDERVEKLTEALPDVDEQLKQQIETRKQGFAKARTDPALGAKVFEERCSKCHRIGDVGEKVGPELDGIGVRGLDRLLEDILDPSRNVDQAFRAAIILLDNNLIRNGLIHREEDQVIVLVDAEGNQETIAKDEIAARKMSSLSPMPADQFDNVPEAELYNLLSFLLAQHPSQ